MPMTLRKKTLLLISPIFAALMCSTQTIAHANSITAFGTPVESIGSSDTVASCGTSGVGSGCYDATTNTINFFIPINSDYNGVYGFDTAPSGYQVGTSSDIATGPFTNADSLTMFLLYSPLASSIPTDLTGAVLEFNFVDLDLTGVNDPDGFLESIQFFSSTGSELSSYMFSGTITSQTITFPDVTSFILGDPFYAKLVFGSSMTESGKWKNTMESMTTTLVTTTVPEPSSALLLALGLVGLGAWRSRQTA